MNIKQTKPGRPQKGLYMNGLNTAILNHSIAYEGKYAIYGLAPADEPENVLYIGFTSTKLYKRYNSHIRSAKNNQNPKEKWLNQLIKEGKKPVMILLEEGIPFFEQAHEKERQYIRKFIEEGVELLNRNHVGFGIRDSQHSEEKRHRLSKVKFLAAENRRHEETYGVVTDMTTRMDS